MKLVFATHNPNKLKEVQQLMPAHIQLVSLEDIGCFDEIPETADTIEGNAILKTDFVKEKYNLDCFADDTGLEVETLNGEPGVFSARYAGKEKDSQANILKLLKNLEGSSNRNARFKTVIALKLGEKSEIFTGICKGEILKEQKGTDGFGYDPIFKPYGKSETFAQMSSEEKNKLSHRGLALQKLINYLTK